MTFEARPSKAAERRARRVLRDTEAWSLRAEGLTFREIGAYFGVTGARAHQMVGSGARLIRASLIRSHAKFRMEK